MRTLIRLKASLATSTAAPSAAADPIDHMRPPWMSTIVRPSAMATALRVTTTRNRASRKPATKVEVQKASMRCQ